jgi:hypothetical protein
MTPVKDNAGMGSLYRSQHELVFVFKQGRDAHRNNVQLGQFGHNRSNVWRYPLTWAKERRPKFSVPSRSASVLWTSWATVWTPSRVNALGGSDR